MGWPLTPGYKLGLFLKGQRSKKQGKGTQGLQLFSGDQITLLPSDEVSGLWEDRSECSSPRIGKLVGCRRGEGQSLKRKWMKVSGASTAADLKPKLFKGSLVANGKEFYHLEMLRHQKRAEWFLAILAQRKLSTGTSPISKRNSFALLAAISSVVPATS